MDKHNDSLLGIRQELYLNLLGCAKSQYTLINSLSSNEKYEETFSELSNQWDQICNEIEDLDHQIGPVKEAETFLIGIMNEIMECLHSIDKQIQDIVGSAGHDLKIVKDQRMLVDAYYGMGRKGLDSMYFDEKK
ncbi:hypothetical protein SAMN04488542_1193 [Fontibacillus panacisegetis]|uniref:Flagellar protein FliT n=1 Tax=Fontibacillus panacisegetis TaxID=670482 RepID=A0A1G7PM39_9BACL|nr:hypothetical protein [Fontibacillus panacisegetis]SDF86719.1 hypothetical protein SAMN04488542_1193 [Fontibacillus panacisegetis]